MSKPVGRSWQEQPPGAAKPVVYEYDPATGKIVATELPDDLFQAAAPGSSKPAGKSGFPATPVPPPAPGKAARPQLPMHAPRPPTPVPPKRDGPPGRRLGASGKAKVRKFVAEATTLEELADIQTALDKGVLTSALAAKLQFEDADFEEDLPAAVAPLGALSLSEQGLLKVHTAIAEATDMEVLSLLDSALNRGDIQQLQDLLLLEDEDLKKAEDDAEYDPFATEPPAGTPAHGPKNKPKSAFGALQGYEEDTDDTSDDVDDDELMHIPPPGVPNASTPRDPRKAPPTKKQKKEKDPAKVEAKKQRKLKRQKLQWPLEWAWLIARTQRHPDYRRPPFVEGQSKRCEIEAPPAAALPEQPQILALSTSLVYAGSTTKGYDPRHLARLSVVDARGEKVLDVLVKPRAEILDYRTHLTGLTREAFESGDCVVELDTAIQSFLKLMKNKDTILIGHRINVDLEAMGVWHGTIVDVSLIFGVDSRRQHRYHSLWYLAQTLAEMEPRDERLEPHDPVEDAEIMLRLAILESRRIEPTPAFPPKQANECEILVRHMHKDWAADAENQLFALCPGFQQGLTTHWVLNENDPTDVRGDTVLTFPSPAVRDKIFQDLMETTELHVSWRETPGAPPLGAFFTEQTLMKEFSKWGVTICARIPRKPSTREPQSFAFISMLHREDAVRVEKVGHAEVQITPTWAAKFKPRLAKYGSETDKRVAVRIGEGEDQYYDYVHFTRAQ